MSRRVKGVKIPLLLQSLMGSYNTPNFPKWCHEPPNNIESFIIVVIIIIVVNRVNNLWSHKIFWIFCRIRIQVCFKTCVHKYRRKIYWPFSTFNGSTRSHPLIYLTQHRYTIINHYFSLLDSSMFFCTSFEFYV